jgi:hypothetical protein
VYSSVAFGALNAACRLFIALIPHLCGLKAGT